jgi:hypothetical protein
MVRNEKRKTNEFSSNILGGELTASPKYNKSNSRGYNKEVQQQKQYRGNANREQRGGGNSRYRNSLPNDRNNRFDPVGVEEENSDDNSNEVFDFDDHYPNRRGGSGGSNNKKVTNQSLNFHQQRVNNRHNRRSTNYSFNRSLSSGNSSYRQSFSKEQFLQAK